MPIVKILFVIGVQLEIIPNIGDVTQHLDAEDVSELSGFFEDEHLDADPEAMVGNREDVSLLQSRLNQLTKREADILRYRYGLDEFPVLTLEEIGKITAGLQHATGRVLLVARGLESEWSADDFKAFWQRFEQAFASAISRGRSGQ